jgi:uncharacterized repeat protein (TIGR01451 family)
MPVQRLRFAALLVTISAVAPASALTVVLLNLAHETCGGGNGSIEVYAIGGTPPYAYEWSNGATTAVATGLSSGTYTVTVTDASMEQATGNWTIGNATALSIQSAAQDGHGNCPGQCWGQVRIIEAGINGTPPYTYEPIGGFYGGIDAYGHPFFYFPNACSGGSEVQIQVTDANGCMGVGTAIVVEPQVGEGPMVVQSVQPVCAGSAVGTATITNIYNGISWWTAPNLILHNAQGEVVQIDYYAGNTSVFGGLLPGHYYVSRDWNPDVQYTAYLCNNLDTVGFDIVDLGPDCGAVQGRLFLDHDQDCAIDTGEPGVPYRVLEILPGPLYTITDAQGLYQRALPNGNYTLGVSGTDLFPLCPAVQPAPFAISFGNATLDLADSSLIGLDLEVMAFSGPARPGFTHTVWGTVRNLGGQQSGAITLTVQFDAQMSFSGAWPAPTSVAGSLVTWDLPLLGAFAEHAFSLQLQVPPDVGLLGLPFSHQVEAVQALTEAESSNNTASVAGVFQGAYDPNDKTAFTSSGWSGSLFYLGVDEWVDYRIRFQNTGTDTAFTVVVTDTIPAALDLTTFHQGVASHPFSVSMKPGRVLEWRFADILLPDSGTNEAASHGLVTFRIRPTLPLAPGTEWVNRADILFDFNPPIRTNDAVLLAESSTAVGDAGGEVLHAFPNPTDEVLFLARPADCQGGIVRILGADGRWVAEQPFREAIGVADLVPGAYTVVLLGQDGGIHRARFVKR